MEAGHPRSGVVEKSSEMKRAGAWKLDTREMRRSRKDLGGHPSNSCSSGPSHLGISSSLSRGRIRWKRRGRAQGSWTPEHVA